MPHSDSVKLAMERVQRAAGSPFEIADVGQSRFTSQGYIGAIKELLDVMRRTSAQCEQCGVNPAAHVRGRHTPGATSAFNLVCRSCSRRYAKAGPIERRRMQLEIARAR
jgi:hypothetical protein